MGTYWNGIKTRFSEINHLENRINQLDFDYLEIDEHPASQRLDFSVRNSHLIKCSTAIECATEYLSIPEKKFYNTFFFHTTWTTYTEEDEKFIDMNKYTNNQSNDELGWLKLDPYLYWKAFSSLTLERIVSDFRKVNFNLIKEKYELGRAKFKKELETYTDFNSSEYQKETADIFSDFMILTNNIVDIYASCVIEKKDLIIELD